MGTEDIALKDALEFKWKEYTLYIDHYKYYLDICLRTNFFFYAITGGVIGFYLRSNNPGTTKYFLLLPILIGTTLSGMFIYGGYLWRKAYINVEVIRRNLKSSLGIELIPDVHLLFLYLLMFGLIFFLVGVSLALLPYVSGDSSWKYLGLAVPLALLGLSIPICAPNINKWLMSETRYQVAKMLEEEKPKKVDELKAAKIPEAEKPKN